jgi:hypothetical protein
LKTLKTRPSTIAYVDLPSQFHKFLLQIYFLSSIDAGINTRSIVALFWEFGIAGIHSFQNLSFPQDRSIPPTATSYFLHSYPQTIYLFADKPQFFSEIIRIILLTYLGLVLIFYLFPKTVFRIVKFSSTRYFSV